MCIVAPPFVSLGSSVFLSEFFIQKGISHRSNQASINFKLFYGGVFIRSRFIVSNLYVTFRIFTADIETEAVSKGDGWLG